MPPLATAPTATVLRNIKSQAAANLTGFDEDAVRNALIQAAGKELSIVADSSTQCIDTQVSSIKENSASFGEIISRMSTVRENVREIDDCVRTLVHKSTESSNELLVVNDKMRTLEEHFSSIDRLLRTVNEIADRRKLLAVTATIEAARAV